MIIYHKYFDDDNTGEVDSFFDLNPDLELITAWSLNDAHYRDEYMSPLFDYLNVEIKPLPKSFNKKALKLVLKAFGTPQE